MLYPSHAMLSVMYHVLYLLVNMGKYPTFVKWDEIQLQIYAHSRLHINRYQQSKTSWNWKENKNQRTSKLCKREEEPQFPPQGDWY